MKKIVIVLTLALFAFSVQAQDAFERAAQIPADALDTGGFGNVIAGTDLDNDGNPEIFAINTDWFDEVGLDLVPRIYKYEAVPAGGWQVVWSTRLPLEFQNTWGAFAVADMDQDGKWEVVWGPVNNFGGGLQPNPERIVVYEVAGDGSDNMGIDNGDGTWRPNAQWTITMGDNENLRPFKWVIADVDGDNWDEIVAGCRAGDGIQIYSVDDVPDNGDGSENWTTEFSGVSGTFYDIEVVPGSNTTVYGIEGGGDVYGVSWDGAAYVDHGVVGTVGFGSWNSAQTVDVDGDTNYEIIVASWNSASSNVYLLVPGGDSLATYDIQDVPDASFRLYGGAAGDADDDGMLDFVFGSRSSTPNALIHRLEYQGGDMTDAANWELSYIDSLVHGSATQYDMFDMGDLDGDGEEEIVYTGTARGASSGDVQPITVLSRLPVGIEDRNNPALVDGFRLDQNYPNPFNPNTTISFEIPTAANVELNIYNIRGQLVKTLLSENRAAGTHQVNWNSVNEFDQKVASGIYIYTLRAGSFTMSKKMTLLK